MVWIFIRLPPCRVFYHKKGRLSPGNRNLGSDELQGKKILGKKIAIVLSYLFARDFFAFGVFLALSQEMPDGAGAGPTRVCKTTP
jgi:hypothetical protein